MNIRYEIKGNKQIKNLYIRLYQGKFDVCAPVGLFVLEDDWNWQTESSISDDLLNIKLQELRLAILRHLNSQFSNGSIITSETLKSIVKEQFNRPTNEVGLMNQDKDVYLYDFGIWWLKERSLTWKVSAKKFISKVQISQYKKVVEQLSEFERFANYKLVMKDLTVENLYEFANYLEENEYNNSTIKRIIGRVIFFLNRANEQGLKVSNAHKQRIYIDSDSDEIDKPYLNEVEINKILNKDFSFDQNLNIAKQNYIILLFTGLRGTDGLKKLDISQIDNDLIKIKTSKTGQTVLIPMHAEVKKVIKQNFGNLPPKMTLTEFNIAIKKIAQVCEIDEVIEGKLWDAKKKRRVRGFYKKYLLLSSHSCRRGFATLYKGVISDDAICSILGWSSNAMLKIYNQTSKKEYAEQLSQIWESKK